MSGGRITPHQVALACGTNGAYVDVTSYVEFGEGITYTYGRPDQFSDPSPGIFTFTLNNADGRFTPDNPASPLATKVTEGMGVSWLLGTRLVHSTITSVTIPADEATWNQIVVTCDDMLGTAGRHQLTSIADGLTQVGNPALWWKLDEAAGSTASPELNGSLLGAFLPTSSNRATTTQLVTYGVTQHPALPGTAVTVTAGPGEVTRFSTQPGNTQLRTTLPYDTSTDTTSTHAFGTWSFWAYPGSTISFYVVPFWAVGAGYSDSMQVNITPTSVGLKGGVNTQVTHTYTVAESTVPHYFALYSDTEWQSGSPTYWAHHLTLAMDGTSIATTFMESAVLGYTVPTAMLTAGTAMQPLEVGFSVTGGTAAVSGTVQRVAHVTEYFTSLEQGALLATEDGRRAVLDTLSTELSSAAYDGRPSLWTAPIGYPDVAQRSVLDVYNDIVRTEQGHMFCTTSGSLLSPSEQIQVRDRDRPTTVKAAFHVTNELDGLPAFVRDITNVAESVDVAGPDQTVTVADPTVLTKSARAITSGLSETVLLTDPDDMRLWGQDRILRGENVGIRIQSFTVDAYTTPTDRSADLLALVPGDRVQVYSLPSASLGFTSWDGWVIGGAEAHTFDGHKFTFTVAPVLPTPGIADTSRAANGGDVTLSASCTATATTLTVTSTSGDAMSTATPYDCTLGTAGEQITVTAVSGNTLTVTRGANGTTAIAHTAAAPIELVSPALAAF